MENEQLFEQMVQLLGQLVTAAGPEWTMEFLQGGLEMAQQGGGEQGPGGPGAMPPMPAGQQQNRGMMGRRLPPGRQRLS